MSKEINLKEIAIKAAKNNPESYYKEPFEPHQWVIDAINMGIKQALEIAAEEAETIDRFSSGVNEDSILNVINYVK